MLGALSGPAATRRAGLFFCRARCAGVIFLQPEFAHLGADIAGRALDRDGYLLDSVTLFNSQIKS